MAVVVNTNIPSISASRILTNNRKDLELAMERLSSGKRINSAKDDAAGGAGETGAGRRGGGHASAGRKAGMERGAA